MFYHLFPWQSASAKTQQTRMFDVSIQTQDIRQNLTLQTLAKDLVVEYIEYVDAILAYEDYKAET